MAAFAQFGSDLDAATQKLLSRGERLTELLKQPQFSPQSMEEQVVVMYAGTRGYLDKLAVSRVGQYEAELLRHMHAEKSSMLDAIRTEKKLSDDTEAELKKTLDAFTANFA